jgi:signal transduction histidine kinase
VSVADPVAAQHLYRIAQEALSNAGRHANASRIMVELSGDDDALLLTVEDDGCGLPAGVSGPGMGLRTMAFRAHLLQGAFGVNAGPAGGTRVSCRVPRAAFAGRQPDPGDGPRETT